LGIIISYSTGRIKRTGYKENKVWRMEFHLQAGTGHSRLDAGILCLSELYAINLNEIT
jgi:hypothetical protein